jgi:hypothetical protein
VELDVVSTLSVAMTDYYWREFLLPGAIWEPPGHARVWRQRRAMVKNIEKYRAYRAGTVVVLAGW